MSLPHCPRGRNPTVSGITPPSRARVLRIGPYPPAIMPADNSHPIATLIRHSSSNLQEHSPRLPHLWRSIRERLAPGIHPHEPLLPQLPRLQPEELPKRIPRRLPRAPDRRQHLARRRLARRAALGVARVVLGRGVGLVELQSLSTGAVDASAGAG